MIRARRDGASRLGGDGIIQTPVSIHIRPTAPLAERALLPDDPGLALALAQALLDGPRMFNHTRGLWGYTGDASDGSALTIQSTGIGGPSAAIVLDELIELGLTRAIRVGTCTVVRAGPTRTGGPAGAIGSSHADADGDRRPADGGTAEGELGRLDLADLLIADAAISADGTSRALGSDGMIAGDAGPSRALGPDGMIGGDAGLSRALGSEGIVAGDADLSRAMAAACATGRRGRVVSTDLFYDDDVGRADRPLAGGALAVDLETAAVFRLGARRGVRVGCVLVVADVIAGGRRTRIDDDGLAAACAQAGRVAVAALVAATGDPPTRRRRLTR
jgi:uridine phosphorylase